MNFPPPSPYLVEGGNPVKGLVVIGVGDGILG